MGEDEYLQLANRSSNPLKRFITLSNGIGVIDSDYYNNPDNEGHIMFQFSNFGLTDITIKKVNESGKEFSCRFLKQTMMMQIQNVKADLVRQENNK